MWHISFQNAFSEYFKKPLKCKDNCQHPTKAYFTCVPVFYQWSISHFGIKMMQSSLKSCKTKLDTQVLSFIKGCRDTAHIRAVWKVANQGVHFVFALQKAAMQQIFKVTLWLQEQSHATRATFLKHKHNHLYDRDEMILNPRRWDKIRPERSLKDKQLWQNKWKQCSVIVQYSYCTLSGNKT